MNAQHVEDIKDPNSAIEVKGLKKTQTEMGRDEDFVVKFLELSRDVKATDEEDKNMSLLQGIRTYPKAAMWSVILSSSIIMEGYDQNVVNNLYGQHEFQKKFGEPTGNGNYEIPANWQTTISSLLCVGQIVGLSLCGYVTERFGYKRTMIGFLTSMLGLVFICFFATGVEMLVVAECLLGIPMGAFQALSLTYASDICPTVLRMYLTTYVNICWLIGQLISSGVLRGFSEVTGSIAYQVPLALQWAWPIPIILALFFAPESPNWAVKKGKLDLARKSLHQLITENEKVPDKSVMAEALIRKLQLTIQQEESENEHASYKDCFKGTNFRRTRIASIAWLNQTMCGMSGLVAFSSYFYIQAGLTSDMAFNLSIVQYALGIVGTILSWFLSKLWGHFTLFFFGMIGMFVMLITMGGLGCSDSSSVAYGISAMLLVFTFIYNCTVGPMTYCLVAELPANSVRNQTIVIARATYSVGAVVVNVISPYMINPTAWNWKAKSGFFWAGFVILNTIWSYFELPETKGRTFAELDQLFADHVPARKFKDTVVNTFDPDKMMAKMGEKGMKNFVEEKEEA